MPKKRLDAVVVHEESAAATIRSDKDTLKFEPATLIILNIFEKRFDNSGSGKNGLCEVRTEAFSALEVNM